MTPPFFSRRTQWVGRILFRVNKLIGTSRCWMMVLWILPCFVSPTLAQVGSVDQTFKPGFDSDVFTTWVQPDGKLLVSGFFTKAGGGGGTSRNGIARLNSNAALDTTFDPGSGAFNTNLNQHATVAAVALQPDGKAVVAGYFNLFNDVPRNSIVRLNANGSLDTAFNPSVDDLVVALALQPDGKILIGGEFFSVNGTPRSHVARLNIDGSLDTTFDPGSGLSASVQVFALQTNGMVIIGGQFTSVNGITRVRMARLNADGSLDTTFNPGAGPNKSVVTLSLQSDGKVVIGGQFNMVGDSTRIFVARLNSDGSLDNLFQPTIAWTSQTDGVLAVQTEVDGKVFVGGQFTMVGGASRVNLARLNADGSLDSSFNPGSGPSAGRNQIPWVRGIAIQADGKVLVGGGFTAFNSTSVNYLARLIGDQGGTVEFDSANYFVDENGGNAAIAVRRTGGTNGAVAVNYLTSDGTATAGADYEAQAGALLFGPGETNKVFTVPIFPDAQVEPNETVNLALGNPIGGVILGTNQTATLTIKDNTNSVPNSAPVLPMQADRTNNELTTLIVTNTASDTDIPANLLTYRLVSPPEGATNDANGVISWTPSEAQGPSTNTITTIVTDNGSPPLSATNSFTVIVMEVNSPPVLSPISDQIAFAGFQLAITNSATDVDVPANVLTFSLDSGAPAAAVIDPTNGVFTWRPATNQAPGTNMVTVRVTDNGVPSFYDTKSFRIVVVPQPIIESIAASNGNVTIDWSAIAGKNYQVEFKSDLSETTWNTLSGDVTATGSTATKTDTSVSGNLRFYRVALSP